MMEVVNTELQDVKIIKPRIFNDARGYFFESYNEREFKEKVADINFVQDNESYSTYGVVRGLHFQAPPFAQAKLVRCVCGKVLDVAIDIRKGSATYGKHVAVELTESNHLQLFIPRGFAHGFAVLSPYAVFQYKCDNFYNKESEGGIYLFDETLDINWKVEENTRIVSEKDRINPLFQDFVSPF